MLRIMHTWSHYAGQSWRLLKANDRLLKETLCSYCRIKHWKWFERRDDMAEWSMNGLQWKVNEVVSFGIYRLPLWQVLHWTLNELHDLIFGIDSWMLVGKKWPHLPSLGLSKQQVPRGTTLSENTQNSGHHHILCYGSHPFFCLYKQCLLTF